MTKRHSDERARRRKTSRQNGGGKGKQKPRTSRGVRRRPSPPGVSPWWLPQEGAYAPTDSHDDRRVAGLIEGHVRERMENLRLLVALKAEIPDVTGVPGLAGEFEGLLEYDRLLVLGLDVWDREGETLATLMEGKQQDLFRIGAHLRGQIRALLPYTLRGRVQAAFEAATVTEAEVWEQVYVMRQRGRDLGKLLPQGFGPAREKLLPETGSIEPWLERLPVAWQRILASQHGRSRLRRAELLPFLLSTLRSEGRLATCLAEKLDEGERKMLVRFTAAGQTLRALLTEEEEAMLAPTWDGQGPVPPLPGVRLRAFGFLHLGSCDGVVEVVTQPAELRQRLARLLLAHHEDALTVLGPRRRSYLEAAAIDGDT